MQDQVITYQINKVVKDSDIITTYFFSGKIDCLPGQFYMVWIPGVDEKPISVGYAGEDEFFLTVAAVGPFTKQMESLRVGDKVGFRGPFGSSFNLLGEGRYIMVGGGVGVPPVALAAQVLRSRGVRVDFIQGARTKDLLIYEDHLEALGCNVHMCTDDGSFGYHGYTTGKLEDLLEDYESKGEKITRIMTCGPEIMMKKVAEIAKEHGIDCEVSVERYMKCGFGICGQCSLDGTGKRMCLEGPVINAKEALDSPEFGSYHRGPTGKKTGQNKKIG